MTFIYPLPSPQLTPNPDDRVEVLGDSKDISHYFLQRSFSQKRRRSIRNDLVMNLQPLSPTEVIMDSPSSNSSPQTSSSSPFSSLSRPPSPIDFFLRRSPTLRAHFYPHLGKTADEQAENEVILERLHRSRSKSFSAGAAGLGINSSNVGEVSTQLKSNDKKGLSSEQISQSGFKSQRMRRGGAGTITHFRPMPYEVKAELDNFFGQTKGQKRQLALRSRDEFGHLWYDRIEQEEFAKLLSSAPNSPIISSRRSSTAQSPCRTPTFGRPRQASIVLGSFPVTLLQASSGQDVACYTYLPLSPRHLLTYGEQPAERRRKRSLTDLRRGNVVIDNEPLDNDFGEDIEQPRVDEHISMPAFLPLRRHQADSALLKEAFSQGEGLTKPATESKTDNFNPTALTSPTKSRSGKRPANLCLNFNNFEESSVSSLRPKERKSLCFTPGSSSFNRENPFDDGIIYHRRGSSIELGRLSSPQRQRADFPYLIESDESPLADLPTRMTENKEKAAAILGKNAGNENLLVPGGLPTGEHVYDGLDIPCRSIHLQSDDEDSDDAVKPKKAFGTVKAWLRSKTGVQDR